MTGPYIVARDLGKSFSGKQVLANVSFSVEPGDVVGVLGKNGAGKTTLLELVLGFTPASTGAVQIFGYDSYRLPGAAKARVGFVPETGRARESADRRGSDRCDRVLLSAMGRRSRHALEPRMGSRSAPACEGHVGRPAAEAIDPSRPRSQARRPHTRRAGREPRPRRASAVSRADHRRGGRRQPLRGVLVAYRVRRRATREQDLDPQGPAHVLARGFRLAQGIDRASARAIDAGLTRVARGAERTQHAAQWHDGVRGRRRLERRAPRRDGAAAGRRDRNRSRAARARGHLLELHR